MLHQTPPFHQIASSVQHQLLNHVSVLEALLEPFHAVLHRLEPGALPAADDDDLFAPAELFQDLARTVVHVGVLVRTQRLLLMEVEPPTAIRSQMVSISMQLAYARQLVSAGLKAEDIGWLQHPMPDLRMRGNSVYLMTAFTAALMNAVEAVRGTAHDERRQIEIRAAQQHTFAHVRIEDTGTGFRQDVLEQITTALNAGTAHHLLGFTTKARPGVGLALMAHVARLHGGHLTVGNHVEHGGAWVEFCLPLDEHPGEANAWS